MRFDQLRIGQGFDVHPWSEDPTRPLVLAGVTFSDCPGLMGHSDADVVAHACTDALLGAAGLGDIGSFFPDTDPSLAGANSIELLRQAVRTVVAAGWTPINADCTVILDAPKVAPRRAEMEQVMSQAVGAPVSIKGKRTEGLISLSEGVQCVAVALIAAR